MISSSESINISPEPVSTIPEPVVSTSKLVNPSSEPKNLMCRLQIGLNIAAIVALILASIKYFLDIKNHYKKQKSKTTTISTSKEYVNTSSEPAIPSSKRANLTSESVNPKSEPKANVKCNIGEKVAIATLLVTILWFLFTICTYWYDKQKEEIIQPAKSAEVDAAKHEQYLIGRKIGNLIWSDLAPNKMDWSRAKQYCENLFEGGFNDWRLPNIDELRTLIKHCPKTETGGECKVSEYNNCLSWQRCGNPSSKESCICEYRENDGGYYSKLENSNGVWLWSSSEVSDCEDKAWDIGFDYGRVSSYKKIYNVHVRCVKNL